MVKGIPQYGTYKELSDHDMIDGSFSATPPLKSGYLFTLHLSKNSDGTNIFVAVASPENDNEGSRTYFVNAEGIIRFGTSSYPNDKSPGIE